MATYEKFFIFRFHNFHLQDLVVLIQNFLLKWLQLEKLLVLEESIFFFFFWIFSFHFNVYIKLLTSKNQIKNKSKHEAYLLGLQSLNGFKLPQKNIMIGFDAQTEMEDVAHISKTLVDLGFKIYTTKENSQFVIFFSNPY